jgi:hypothetical protein
MAEEVKKEEDSEWGSDDEDEDEDEDDEYALRGFRFMFNRLAGEPDDEEDILEENEDNEEAEEEEEEPKPSPEFIAQKLTEQGVTMVQLVKAMLVNHAEYENEESFDRVEGDLFGKLRIIISNYHPEPETPRDPPPSRAQASEPAQASESAQASEPVQAEAPVPSVASKLDSLMIDYSAQPKSYRFIRNDIVEVY